MSYWIRRRLSEKRKKKVIIWADDPDDDVEAPRDEVPELELPALEPSSISIGNGHEDPDLFPLPSLSFLPAMRSEFQSQRGGPDVDRDLGSVDPALFALKSEVDVEAQILEALHALRSEGIGKGDITGGELLPQYGEDSLFALRTQPRLGFVVCGSTAEVVLERDEEEETPSDLWLVPINTPGVYGFIDINGDYQQHDPKTFPLSSEFPTHQYHGVNYTRYHYPEGSPTNRRPVGFQYTGRDLSYFFGLTSGQLYREKSAIVYKHDLTVLRDDGLVRINPLPNTPSPFWLIDPVWAEYVFTFTYSVGGPIYMYIIVQVAPDINNDGRRAIKWWVHIWRVDIKITSSRWWDLLRLTGVLIPQPIPS
jgi:hypothetical protein